jgi:hypothetical protein
VQFRQFGGRCGGTIGAFGACLKNIAKDCDEAKQSAYPAPNHVTAEMQWAFVPVLLACINSLSVLAPGRVGATLLGGQQYFGRPDNFRRVADIILNQIYERLADEKGYFETNALR